MSKASLVLYLLVVIFLSGCKRQLYSNTANVVTDTVATAALPAITPETIIKTSPCFNLNGTECYWKHVILNNDELIISLLDNRSNSILLEHSDIYHPRYYDANGYFDQINEESLEDVNFDGFTDIMIHSHSATTPMNDAVHIYLYDRETKAYSAAEALSDNRFVAVDKPNRKLVMSNEWRFGTDTTIHHFDSVGRILFNEIFSDYTVQEDTTWIKYKSYQKVVNGETIINRTEGDTLKW